MAEQEFLIRTASADDAAAVWPLTRAFATSYAPERAAFDESFTAILSASSALALVAEGRTHPGLAGYAIAHIHPALFANGPVAWIEELMVDERERRRGVASQLVSAVEQWAADGAAAYIALATRHAELFYRSLGYEDSAVFFRKSLEPARTEPERT